MAINLQALKDEINTNAAGLAYVAFVEGNDSANADVINNANGANPRTLNHESISAGDFVGATTFDAYDGLTASETAYFDMIANRETVAVTDDTLANFAAIGGTSKWAVADKAVMEPRMVALMQYTGSRAQEISDTLGASNVTGSDVQQARLLP